MSDIQKNLSNILKRYLSHIVYIDDEFKISWEVSQEIEVKRPSRSSRVTYDNASVQTEAEPSTQKSDLNSFCQYVQSKYPEILLTPILYTSATDQEQVLSCMRSARLLILDWSLAGEKITAVHLLEKAAFSNQLRFCVIYTSKMDDAKNELFREMKSVSEQGMQKGIYQGKDYEFVMADSIIYMLCEKDKFDLGMIVDAFAEIFVNEIGYFPISFIDMISRLEDKVPYYLKKFSHPFDKLLLLQTSEDGLPLDDVYQNMKDMVFNNIRADIELDGSVLENIYEQQICMLKELTGNDERFQEKLKQSLEYILERLDCNKENKDIFQSISSDQYKDIVKKAISDPRNLSRGIEKASKKLATQYCNKKAEKVLQENEMPDKSRSNLISVLSKAYKTEELIDRVKAMLPTCLMILADPEQSYNINSLIMSLNTVAYDENEKRFAEMFSGCYEEDNGTMCVKKNREGYPILGLLENKLKPGDIFFKDGEKGTCYLCITPSCHLLRPKKVEGNILFVKGKIVSSPPRLPLRDSEHFNILPGIDDENVPMRVVWQYHRIAEIDLNKISCQDFTAWVRPYRLSYEYIRQIIGEFVAFYSKSGVDKLFLESDASLQNLLIANK